MNKKQLKAFTLAEVLITLTIIGVIAALTIPNLLQKYQNYQLATKFKKTYAVLSEAVRSVSYEVDMDKVGDNYQSGSNLPNASFRTALQEHLKVRKYCGGLDGTVTWNSACYNNQTILVKALNGNVLTAGSSLSQYGYYGYNFILDDGSFIAFLPATKNNGIFWSIKNMKIRGLFSVDVNGLTQGPNKIGRDIFYIKMDGNGKLSPYGVGVADDCIKGGIGNTCAKKIIVDKNLDY